MWSGSWLSWLSAGWAGLRSAPSFGGRLMGQLERLVVSLPNPDDTFGQKVDQWAI